MPPVNVEELRGSSSLAIQGEVRFDKVSRALYSTDASVYRIEPIGRRRSRDRARTSSTRFRSAGQHRCSLTMRGGGTSQAGQAIGPGLQIDTSKLASTASSK